MLEMIPGETREGMNYYLIEMDREGRNNFTYPHTGKSRSAQSLAALSQVGWTVRSVCESFLWKTICFSRPQRPNELEALSEIGSRLRHLRSLHARVSLSNSSLGDNGVIDPRSLDYFSDLRDYLTNLNQCSLKHVRLYTSCDIEINRLSWLQQTNNLLFNQLKTAHRDVTYALFNFPLLTSLDISGACYTFVPEDDIAQCIRQLPHLVRFRAHNSVAPYHLNLPRRLMLGRALARLRSLEELSLQNLDSPDQSWCDLDWKGPLKALSIKRCLGLTGEALYRFILKFPTITDIRLISQFEQSNDPYSIGFQSQTVFRSLKNFTFLGFRFNTELFNVLSEAPHLEKLHIHSAHRQHLLEKMKQSIEENNEAWPGLKSLVFSSVPPEDETRIRLENWALGRLVTIKFHGTQQTPLPEIVDQASEDEDENQMELDSQNSNHVETEGVPLNMEASIPDSDNNNNAAMEASPSDIQDVVADVNSSDVEDRSSDDDYFAEEEFDEYADLYDGFPSPELEDNGFLAQIEAAEAAALQLEAVTIQVSPVDEVEDLDSDSDSDETDTDLSGQDAIEENADLNGALDNEDALSVPGSNCSELEELDDWTSSIWIRDHE